jgi:tRNA U34 2-thiouridine synthase MnmA/TrmU
MRAVSLLSGGLDSLLATKLVLDQGIEVFAFNSVTVFCTCTPKNSSCSAAQTAVRQLGVPLKSVNSSEELIEAVKNPKHGYGSQVNPCLDCRTILFRKGAKYMREIGASFIVTGDVLGERPMSQRLAAMKLTERKAGLEGLVVRPLSASLLEPTIPEKEGWVDRKKFLRIQGRSRKPQIELADCYGFKDYPCPAGGCRLTEPAFAARMRDLMKYKPDFDLQDIVLLKHGRHFRLSPLAKAVVGREEEENDTLSRLGTNEDIFLRLADIQGPLTLIRGRVERDQVLLAAAITARYGKAKNLDLARVSIVNYAKHSLGGETEFQVQPAGDEVIDPLRIGLKS